MAASFCWQCGKKLEQRDGQLVFETVKVDGNDVRVHKVCKRSALAYQRFDTTPEKWESTYGT